VRYVRVMRLLVLALALSISACGSRSTAPASTTPTATAIASSDEDVAPAAETPCTQWDPSADPTTPPLDVAAPPAGARDGGDGLRFCILRRGTSTARPTRESRVQVHYTGWTTDGQMFDSSHSRGEPLRFAVTEVIRGWTDSLLHMNVGQVRRVWIPEELAYRGQEGMPAGMLVFDIELVAIDR
jgi:hypothetical protein